MAKAEDSEMDTFSSTPEAEESFSLPVHSLVAGLSKMYDKQSLWDVEIQVEGRVFRAHKLVLAAVSPYFEAAFVGTFKEANEKKPLVLKEGVNSDGMELVLRAMYTMELPLNDRNVINVLTTAHFLQWKDLVVFCEKFMLENMIPSNCLKYLRLAEVYSLDGRILQKAEDCFLRNFQLVSEEEEFLQLEKDALVRYLDSAQLVARELDVLKAALRWLQHIPGRSKFAADILGSVRLALLSTTDLMTHALRTDVVRANSECERLVDEAIRYSAEPLTQPLYTGRLNKPRATETLVLFEEGSRYPSRYDTEDKQNTVHFCKLLDGAWDTWTDAIDVPLAFYSAQPVAVNNFLFLHGVDARFIGNVMQRFDGATRTWLHLTPIPQQATVGYVAALAGDSIVLSGGLLIDKESVTTVALANIMCRTFRYSIERNEWQVAKDAPYKVAFAAGCSLTSRQEVFVTGGYTDVSGSVRKTAHVVAYNAQKDIWISKPSLHNPRVQHNCAEFNGKVYVVGGGGNPEPEVSDTCEVFCPKQEQWTVVRTSFSVKGIHQTVFRNQLLGVVGKRQLLKFVPDRSKWKKTELCSPCKVTCVAVLKVTRPV